MGYNILLVDDEPRTIQGIQKVLNEHYQGTLHVQSVANGHEALVCLRREPIDLLITDIRMPGMSGIELVSALREEKNFVTTILLTGHAEFKYAKSAITLNVISYLLKPIGKQKLISEIDHALQIIDREKIAKKGIQLVEQHPNLFVEESHAVDNPLIRQVVSYVHSHFTTPITLEMVASEVHVHRSYLSTLFKEQMEKTFSEYLNMVRIQRAKRLLQETPLRIYEIATAVGYTSSKYFVTVFKDQEGITPNKFREQYTQ